MATDYAHELSVARTVARMAAEYVLTEYARFVPIPDAPASISTSVDRGAQEIILKGLVKEFPLDAYLAEEDTAALAGLNRTGRRLWIIDPIDGTRGFAMKNGEFCVMLGLTVDGVPVLGVVVEPIVVRETYAAQGSGCWVRTNKLESLPCRVTTTNALSQSTLVKSHSKPGKPSSTVTKLGPANTIETYSAGIKLALVARGEADLYVNGYPTVFDWDACAGHALVVEAGGVVTSLTGEPFTYGIQQPRAGMLATNGILHPATVTALTSHHNI